MTLTPSDFESLCEAMGAGPRGEDLASPLVALRIFASAVAEANPEDDPTAEALIMRWFTVTPFAYWSLARWIAALNPRVLQQALNGAGASDWSFADENLDDRQRFEDAIRELADHLLSVSPPAWAIDSSRPLLDQKYRIGRALAIRLAASAHGVAQTTLEPTADQIAETWPDWFELGASSQGCSRAQFAQGVEHAAEFLLRRGGGSDDRRVGWQRVLLDLPGTLSQPFTAVVSAHVIPAPESLNGLIVP
ncbi:MAG: hypothetical protein AAGG01_21875, partial [Planctomycetota bacterium]